MAESLKTFFSPALVRRLAADIVAVHPPFPESAFIRKATAGLDELALLERARHIASALAACLPPSYPDAVDVLLRSLGPQHESDELIGGGMGPFFYLPHLMFIVDRGLDRFDLSMHAQYELTKRFTAEFSIRYFIERDPERAFAFLRRWAADDNAHVRRLVSEGTRLRLPWARRVAWLDQHPERVIELLELLKDDPASVVRRSVANNLNDLGKVRPDVVERICTAWLVGASAERRALVEHALRSAARRGEPYALRLLGFGARPRVAVEDVSFEPPRVAIGGKVTMRFVLRSRAKDQQELRIDAAVHFVKARGTTSAKVFKLKRVTLGPRATVDVRTTFSLANHTTRVPRAGVHEVEVIVNGERMRAGRFDVVAARRTRRDSH